MKVEIYNTSDMNLAIGEIFIHKTLFVEDGITEYTIGEYVSEYEEAENKEDYCKEDVELLKKLDKYFLSLGAEMGENVLVYHGTYKKFNNN